MQYSNVIWRNGQPYSEMFDDIYYSSNDNESIPGEGEFQHVFFKHNHLPARWRDCKQFVIGELGFGSGINCILTIREWLNRPETSLESKRLHYIAIEKYPLAPAIISELVSRYPQLRPYYDELLATYPPAIEGVHSRYLFDDRVVIHYRFMDVINALQDESLNVDAWYMDGFSPTNNPDMWSLQVFELLAKNSHEGSTCSTYTSAGFVRRNMQAAGLNVKRVEGYGNKREMLAAVINYKNPDSYRYKDRPWFRRPLQHDTGGNNATIVGSGIAGLSAAYALTRRGWQVTVIDRHGDIAKEATSNPAPIVYPRLSVNNDVDMAFFTGAYNFTLYMLETLQQRNTQKFWFGDGLLQLMDKQRMNRIMDKFGFNSDYISIVEDSNDAQLTVEFPSGGVVLPAVLCEVLKKECADRLHIISAEVTNIHYQDHQWQCLTGPRLITQSGVLVIANGTGVNATGLPIKFPVEAIRGQVVELKAKPESRDIKQTINASVHVTPGINGKHYLGASYTRNSDSLDIDPDETRCLLESLSEIYPGMFGEADVIGAWAGFRAMSRDRVPVAGAVPDMEFFAKEYADIYHGKVNKNYLPARHLSGLYISAAHGSRGFTSSFLCAEIIASLIEGEPLPVPECVLDHLNPSRFIINDLKRR